MRTKIISYYVLTLVLFGTKGQRNVMKSISTHVGNVILECRGQVGGYGKQVMKEFQAFWDSTHEINHTKVGCAVSCMMKKLDIVDQSGHLKQNNLNGFLKANGADDEVRAKLKKLLDLCVQAARGKRPKDNCVLGLEFVRCFRYGIFGLEWEPLPGMQDHDGDDI